MITTFTIPIIAFALIIFNQSPVYKLEPQNHGIHKTTHVQLKDEASKPAHHRYPHIDPKTGLRTSYYRGALPDTVPGGTRITLQQAYQHYKNNTAIFLDVMAHTGAGPSPIDGHWQLSAERQNIPNSIWLADVGTGTLTKEMQHYFKSNLKILSNKHYGKPIIIYCTADCWMAWNAVQRAAHWGHNNILWFPEGTDDWQQAGYPLEKATPIPLNIPKNE